MIGDRSTVLTGAPPGAGEIDAGAVVDLGRLALDFGLVERITRHPDRWTPETDTTHTVMLGLIGCALAQRYFPELDSGRVAQFALVHDLVEVYAGDTPTLRMPSKAAREAKQRREKAAYQRIRAQFGTSLPWLPNLIGEYETQTAPEARFIKALDKLAPKFTHLLNGAVTVRREGMSTAELTARYAAQAEELQAYAADFPALLELRAVLVDRVLELLDDRQGLRLLPGGAPTGGPDRDRDGGFRDGHAIRVRLHDQALTIEVVCPFSPAWDRPVTAPAAEDQIPGCRHVLGDDGDFLAEPARACMVADWVGELGAEALTLDGPDQAPTLHNGGQSLLVTGELTPITYWWTDNGDSFYIRPRPRPVSAQIVLNYGHPSCYPSPDWRDCEEYRDAEGRDTGIEACSHLVDDVWDADRLTGLLSAIATIRDAAEIGTPMTADDLAAALDEFQKPRPPADHRTGVRA
jgi:putative hydrolases of HD superfamily